MPDLLARYTPLPIAFAVGGEPVFLGRTPVAPANHHLLLTDGRVAVTRGPRENGFRPALDPLFRTAARWYGARASASSSPADSTTGRAASRA